MIKAGIKTTIAAGFCCLALCCLLMPQDVCCEESKAALNKEERAKVNYLMTLETENDINTLLSQPVEGLAEKILKNIEEAQDIEIRRSSMVKTDKCLHELLTSLAHLTKISSGNKIERVVIKLTGTTSRASIWDSWEIRKLEAPMLAMTLYYDDPTVAPSEISCQGYQYH